MAQGRLWAVRMKGGPTKIVRSKKDISESTVKQVYRDSFKHRSTDVDQDPDSGWPLLEPIDETELNTKYAWCLEKSTVTGAPRALVEI